MVKTASLRTNGAATARLAPRAIRFINFILAITDGGDIGGYEDKWMRSGWVADSEAVEKLFYFYTKGVSLLCASYSAISGICALYIIDLPA